MSHSEGIQVLLPYKIIYPKWNQVSVVTNVLSEAMQHVDIRRFRCTRAHEVHVPSSGASEQLMRATECSPVDLVSISPANDLSI